MGRDAITGLVVLATSLVLLWATLGLQQHPLVPVGPGFYPRIVLGVTAVLALWLVALDLWEHRRRPRVKEAAPPRNYALVALTFGVFAFYVIALPYLGFRLATFVFLIGMQVALEPPRRRGIAVIALALVATAAIYYAFEFYLYVLLPRGLWTGF